MKVTDILANSEPIPLPKAHNLDRIWWWDGYVLAKYKGRAQLYAFGPNIPESSRDKIAANPFPDRLFNLIIQKKFKCHKAGNDAARS